MSDEIINEVEDTYKEHELHSKNPDPKCSECWNVLRNHACMCIPEYPEILCEICELFANKK